MSRAPRLPAVLVIVFLLGTVLPPPGAAQSVDARLGVVGLVSTRHAVFDDAVGTASGTLAGGELLVRMRWVGVSARLFGGSFAADSGTAAVGDVHNGDLRLLVGPPALSGDIGYGRRSFAGAIGPRAWSFVRLGARSVIAIGGTGLDGELRVAYYVGVDGGSSGGGGSGREVETRLTYGPPRLPLYLGVGYRFEAFTVQDPAAERPEEVGGLLFTAGVRVRR